MLALKASLFLITKLTILSSMKKITLDQVERLSRGKRSGGNIGSRSIGHHLMPFERDHYRRALKQGYLDINEKSRANLWHIWHKACAAQNWLFLVLIKERETASIYQDEELIVTLQVKEAKIQIKELARKNRH